MGMKRILDLEGLLSEALTALEKVGKRAAYDAKVKPSMSTEVRVNIAEAMLKEAGVTPNTGKLKEDVAEQLLTESAVISEEYMTSVQDPRELQVRSTMIVCKISESDARRALGLGPKGLNTTQTKEYNFALGAGLSEADALKYCRK
jgi:hypothetical protein